ncbi:MAG: dihydrofolate reductase family protein [Candidatus Angelobacter sp.]
MKRRRKIVVSIAMSTDGFIARPDGDVTWLDRPGAKGDYGMGKFFKTIDTILWGRKTYAKGIEMGMKSADFGKGIKHYLFSHHPRKSLLPGFEWTSKAVKTFAQRLRAQSGKDIWMMDGELIASFLDEGEIDEFRIHVIPILIGEGIPLIQSRHLSIPLKLVSSKAFPDGVVELNYRVEGHS